MFRKCERAEDVREAILRLTEVVKGVKPGTIYMELMSGLAIESYNAANFLAIEQNEGILRGLL
jgi:hypothetical protein